MNFDDQIRRHSLDVQQKEKAVRQHLTGAKTQAPTEWETRAHQERNREEMAKRDFFRLFDEYRRIDRSMPAFRGNDIYRIADSRGVETVEAANAVLAEAVRRRVILNDDWDEIACR
jgi:hypothetical protein